MKAIWDMLSANLDWLFSRFPTEKKQTKTKNKLKYKKEFLFWESLDAICYFVFIYKEVFWPTQINKKTLIWLITQHKISLK